MINIFLPEHIEILKAFNQYEVEYLLVGGYAVMYHGYDRTTGDMDIWLKPSNENKQKVIDSFEYLGFSQESLEELNKFDFTQVAMFYLGVEPKKMEFMTKVSLVDFTDAYLKKSICPLDEDFEIPVINLNDLILTKINTGRLKDQADIEELQKIQNYKNK